MRLNRGYDSRLDNTVECTAGSPYSLLDIVLIGHCDTDGSGGLIVRG